MKSFLYQIIWVYLFTILCFTRCQEEEIVYVYSKISTSSPSGITSKSAVAGGNITEVTKALHEEYGICWDLEANPTVYHNKLALSGEPEVGSYSLTMNSLKPATTYHVRAFIKDNKKYIYGEDISFTTQIAALPVVSTSGVTDITSVYAYSGGNVTSQGDGTVSARGVCFDTLTAPTLDDKSTFDGWGTGSFQSIMTGLKPNKKYYVRAFAMSEYGLSYGAEKNFTTDNPVFSLLDYFNNNDNDWYVGTEQYLTASITGGEYVCTYNQSGYAWRTWQELPDFLTMAKEKDFEIHCRLKILPPDLSIRINGTYHYYAGLIWNSGTSNFKYFIIDKKLVVTGLSQTTTSYYYSVGTYDGSYAVWQDYTLFTGLDYNKLSVKVADNDYYFFINDNKVYSKNNVSITYNGVGFYISNAKIQADYLTIQQNGEKKSMLCVPVETMRQGIRSTQVVEIPQNVN